MNSLQRWMHYISKKKSTNWPYVWMIMESIGHQLNTLSLEQGPLLLRSLLSLEQGLLLLRSLLSATEEVIWFINSLYYINQLICGPFRFMYQHTAIISIFQQRHCISEKVGSEVRTTVNGFKNFHGYFSVIEHIQGYKFSLFSKEISASQC